MFEDFEAFRTLGLLAVSAPVGLFAVLGLASLLRDKPLTERAIVRCVQLAIITGLMASVSMLVLMLAQSDTQVPIEMESWVHTGDEHHGEPSMSAAKSADLSRPGEEMAAPTAHERYHFVFKFEYDRLSLPFVVLTFVLCGVVGAFASRYMHREPGFNRFFLLYSLFVVGMVMTSLAGTIETLFCGWELVGLSSALLVAFFHERPAPPTNGLHVWIIYRISDAALLMVSIVLHHMKGEGDFDKFLTGEWPDGVAALQSNEAFFVGLLLLIAAMGKSAMIPFSGWLPRAMEGPTPSSAVFYGALSVHLGAFLLLRFSPILMASPLLRFLVIAVGLGTALFATFAGEVQTDIKSALSFASLAQVGLIFAEIGFDLQYLALVHIMGHGCLRTLQFLRAPTLLHDYRLMEDAIGERLPRFSGAWLSHTPEKVKTWYYRLALERGYLDAYLKDWCMLPFLKFFRHCDSLERRWIQLFTGPENPELESLEPPQNFEDLV